MLTLMMAADTCGDRKTSDFGTAVFKNPIGLVVRQCWCGVGSRMMGLQTGTSSKRVL